jgi:hypothetical protein
MVVLNDSLLRALLRMKEVTVWLDGQFYEGTLPTVAVGSVLEIRNGIKTQNYLRKGVGWVLIPS